MSAIDAPAAGVPVRPRPGRAARRRRLVPAAVALVAVLAAAVALTLGGGSSLVPPATGAASLVPADALAYVNLSIDPSRPAVKQSLALAKGFASYPLISTAVLSRVGTLLGSSAPADFATDIRPWLGTEAALAVLDTASSTAGSLIVLDVTDRSRARTFLTKEGVTPDGAYRGIPLLRSPNGTALAFLGHYLTLGQDASVRAAIDVSAGATHSLERDPTYVRAVATEPAGRLLDAYASGAGVQRVLASQRGVIGALGSLLYQPALQGVAISLSPEAKGMRVQIHSELDPALVKLKGTAPTPFTPSLQNVIPAGSALLLDVTGLDKLAPKVLGAGAVAGIAGGVGPLLSRLGTALTAEGVNVGSILSIFHGETAVAISPGAAGHAPSLVIVARMAHEAQSRAALASLEVPLAQLFSAPASGSGVTPEFNDTTIDGVAAHQLELTTGLHLDYAVWNGLVAVSTSLDGLASVIGSHSPLAKEQQFRAAALVPQTRITSLLFLDLRQLLSLGEQMGLTHSALSQALMPDLERIQAVGMNSTGGEADSTAELSLQFP